MNCLDGKIKIFRDKIYAMKRLMTIHSVLIGIEGNFFAFLTGSLIYRQVLIEMNSLFGDGNKLKICNVTCEYIKDEARKREFRSLVSKAMKYTKELVQTRKKYFVHTDDFDIEQNPPPPMDYAIYFPLLNDIEEIISELESTQRPTVIKTMDDFEAYDPAVKNLREIVKVYTSTKISA